MAFEIRKGKQPKIKVSKGFILLAAVIFWLDEGIGLLLPALASAALHELGHIVAILLAGGTVKSINITAIGGEIELDGSEYFNYWQDAAVAAAGPFTSFLTMWLAIRLRWWIVAGMGAVQGIFNLLPVGPLDGGRVLYALMAGIAGEIVAEKVLFVFSAAILGILLGIGLVMFRQYGNPTLTITAGWLLVSIFSRKRGNNL